MNLVILQSLGIKDEKVEALKKAFSAKGIETTYYPEAPKTKQEAITRIENAEIIMTVNHPLDKEILASAKNLKMVSIAFTGYDHVDIDYCKQNGITVCNAAGYATDAVAELTFGLILSLLRFIPACNQVTRQGGTRAGLIGQELKGKTLGIVGTGAIGMRVAELGSAFGCTLLGYSRTKKTNVTHLNLRYVDLPTLLKTSDIVSVHTPLTPQTKDLISWKEFALMKPSAILIQTSRGGTVNEEALVDALNTNKIAGAGVDVFVQEPPVDLNNPLLTTTHSVLSPHVAFATHESLDRRANIAINNIFHWLDRQPQNVVC